MSRILVKFFDNRKFDFKGKKTALYYLSQNFASLNVIIQYNEYTSTYYENLNHRNQHQKPSRNAFTYCLWPNRV